MPMYQIPQSPLQATTAMDISIRASILLMACLSLACGSKPLEAPKSETAFEDVPNWAKEAIWYQIYPDIFCNGDPSNDPRKQDIKGSYPGYVPEDWHTTAWTHDWYEAHAYLDEIRGKTDNEGYTIQHFAQYNSLRHYGGDLQGILDKVLVFPSLTKINFSSSATKVSIF